jgi:signal transduction histidine kinase
MEPFNPRMPDADLARRRAEIRRSLLRVSSAGLVVVLVVVGLAVAAVLAAFRAQQHAQEVEAATTRAEDELRNSYLAQSRAGRLSGVMGSKGSGLAAVTAAARIRPGIEARSEAIAHLALLDLRDAGLLWKQPGSGYLVVFDPSLEQFAMGVSASEFIIGRVADQHIVCRHTNSLARLDRPLKFSPDGRHLAVAYRDQSLMVFDIAAQRPAFRAKSSGVVRGVSFSPDGALTAFVHADHSVRLVRTADGEEVHRLQPDGSPFLVQFDSTGTRLAIAADRRLQVMDWATNKTVLRLTHDAALSALAWSGPMLAFGDDQGEMVIRHEVARTQRRFVAHKGRVTDLIFSADAEQVLSASYDGSTRMWDAHSSRLVVSTTIGYARQISRDGRRIAYANAQGWGLWDVERPAGYRTLHTVDGSKPVVLHLDFSADGRLLTLAKEGVLRIADLETGEFLLNHRETGLVAWAHFLPDGRTLLTAPKGALDLRPFSFATNGGARRIELSPGRRIELPGGISAGIGSMSPDRRKAVFPLDRSSLGVVELQEPYSLKRFEGSSRALRPALGPGDSWMVSGSLHGAGTLLWDAATGEKRRRLSSGNAYCFANADGSLVAVAGSDTCRVFDTHSWEVVKEISSERGTELPNYAAFSADGCLFAIVKENSRVQLWDPRSWREIADLISPDPQIISWLAFSPDTKRLAVATNRDRVELWDLGTLRAELGRIGLDWSDDAEESAANQATPAAPPDAPASPVPLLLVAAAGGVALVLLCAGFVLRRQRELMRAFFDVDRQMEQRTQQLEVAQAEILHGQKMKALGTLAAGIAHDFNNLLSIIRMANRLTAKQAQADPEVQDNVRLVEKAVGQGKQLVNAMLGYSREPAGEQGPCSLAEVVENAVGLLSKQFLSGIDLQLDLDRNLPPVSVAQGRLEQILLNLVVNASEAMKGRGALRIAVQAAKQAPGGWVLAPAQTGRCVQLVVADTGPGIAPDILPRIFEPFFTTKNAGATRGTGLGLSMVYTLAQNEGFGLRVETEVGQGTTFSILISIKESIHHPERSMTQ